MRASLEVSMLLLSQPAHMHAEVKSPAKKRVKVAGSTSKPATSSRPTVGRYLEDNIFVRVRPVPTSGAEEAYRIVGIFSAAAGKCIANPTIKKATPKAPKWLLNHLPESSSGAGADDAVESEDMGEPDAQSGACCLSLPAVVSILQHFRKYSIFSVKAV